MNYVPVRINTLRGYTAFNFNVYIKLPHKYLLYIKDGDDIETERLKRLKKQKVRKLFIEDKDEANYQGFLDKSLEAITNDPNATTEDKASVATGVSESATEQIYENPEAKASFNAAKRASKGLVKLLTENDDVLKSILMRDGQASSDEDEKMHVHAVNSSSLAIRFGEFMGLRGKRLENLGIASLYHDIGYLQMTDESKKYFFQEIKEVGVNEIKEYKEHPMKAAEVLQDKEFMTSDIMDLIITHEERVDASGFPKKLKKLSKVQEVHALCTYYDRRITCLGEDPSAVREEILLTAVGQFNLKTLEKFKNFLDNLELTQST